MKVLELFAGTRSIGKAFEARGHEVFSVEWDKKFSDIDMYADISTLTAQDILEKFGRPDVIWASPDCATFSIAAISHHRRKNPETGNGRWERSENESNDEAFSLTDEEAWYYWKCSACREDIRYDYPTGRSFLPKYCPNCGAKCDDKGDG